MNKQVVFIARHIRFVLSSLAVIGFKLSAN
jgi:hypothetical protein